MAVSRKTAEALSAIRTRVKDELGDTDTVDPRWADPKVNSAINNMLVEMGNEMALRSPGEALLRVSLEYSGTSPVDLPAAVGAEAIYRVDDITDNNAPVQVEYASPLELDEFDPGIVSGIRGRFRYTLLGPSTDADTYRILLYPKNQTNRTLRIHYIATPYTMGADTDTSPLSPRWVELLCLGAALKLLRRDDEATMQQQMAYISLWNQFKQFSRRQRGPQRIRRRRKGVS